jgi:hypothetical protein
MTQGGLTPERRRRIAEASRFRCSYCLISQRIIGPLLELEHIIPISRGGTDDDHNLRLACPLCNRHKSHRIEATNPETGALVPLFHPRTDVWSGHFAWSDSGTRLVGRTAKGRATIVALNMNRSDAVLVRGLWARAGWHPPPD